MACPLLACVDDDDDDDDNDDNDNDNDNDKGKDERFFSFIPSSPWLVPALVLIVLFG